MVCILNMGNDHREQKTFDEMYNDNIDMFGHPYRELQNYFIKYPIKGTLLDLGCGQGRDSIFLASIGYQVTAVDNSEVGVKQMMNTALKKKLKIDSIIGDVLKLKLKKKFDIILFDMLLHSFEKFKQIELLNKYFSYLNENGIICIVFPEDMTSTHFTNIFESLPYDWKMLNKIIINDVPKLKEDDDDYTFIMIVVQLLPKD